MVNESNHRPPGDPVSLRAIAGLRIADVVRFEGSSVNALMRWLPTLAAFGNRGA